jgi:DNA-binding NtrC family response regulator
VASILIVDDEVKLGRLLAEMLDGQGHEVVRAGSGQEALAQLRASAWDLVVTDLRMPEVDGLKVLSAARSAAGAPDVVVMTAYASAQSAVEAMKQGACDYLVKPFAMDEFRLRVSHILERRALAHRAEALAERLGEGGGFARIVAQSPRMREIVAAARRVAQSDATVLLLGESGTGKSQLARAIHQASPRAAGPLCELHCAALPESLLESELFGHAKGAFTGAHTARRGHLEVAAGGTLFLDEIAEIPPSVQVKLLRFLQEREFVPLGATEVRSTDVRVVAATNRDLAAALRAGTFREDLYYRLSVFPIEVPPLRERIADLPELACQFLARRGVPPDRLQPAALERLCAWRWPGNVRELENVLERALILAGPAPIRPEHLPATLAGRGPGAAALDEVLAPGFSLDAFERELIHHALARAGGNKTTAARLLGISRRRLYSRLKSLENENEDGEPDKGD